MYLNELPLEFDYDFLGVNAGMYEAKPPFCPQPAPIKIWLASIVIHACTEEKRKSHWITDIMLHEACKLA